MTLNPTGTQFTITHGRFAAVVTEVGATLRSLTFDGQEMLWTFAENEAPSGSMGRQLLPWPNRIRDGRYTFDGRDATSCRSPRCRAHTALHGLDEGVAWQLVQPGGRRGRSSRRATTRSGAGTRCSRPPSGTASATTG